MSAVDLVILAGGRGTRAGHRLKASFHLPDGRTLFEAAVARFAGRVGRTIVVAPPPLLACLPPLAGVTRVEDAGEGPAAALAEAAAAAAAPWVFAVGVDMPTVSPALLDHLLAHAAGHAAVAAASGGHLEPLGALYATRILLAERGRLAGRSLASILRAADAARVELPPALTAELASINTLEDLARFGLTDGVRVPGA